MADENDQDNENQENENSQEDMEQQEYQSPDSQEQESSQQPASEQNQKTPITDQINSKIHSMRQAGEKIASGGSAKNRAKKLQKQYEDPYARHRAKEDQIKSAINTTEPIAKPNALRLQAKKASFDKMAKANKKILDDPKVTGPNADPENVHQALKIADKIDNKLNRKASEMKREQRTIKQQEMIAKAGPYGRIIALFLGCKNWCLGHAMIICTVTGGLGYVVLKLTGAI